MNVFELNLEVLKERNKKFYEKVSLFIKNENMDFDRFEIIETRNGEKTIEIEDEGKKIRLNSAYNPQKEAEQWVKKLNFYNLDITVFMFGIGNGVFVKTILERLQEQSSVVLVEPDPLLFIFCLHNFDMREIISDERVAIVVEGFNFEEFNTLLTYTMTLKTLNTQIVCFHPNIQKIYASKFEEFNNAIIKRMRRCKLDYNTRVVLGRHTMENTLKNLHFIRESNFVTEFIDVIPKSIPFIIVAAGPSLDKNIEQLKKAEGKSFILVVDRAVNDVIQHGIKFDAIITIDAGKSVKYMNNEQSFSYPIFTCQDSNNEILELNEGRKIWLNSTEFLNRLYKKYDVRMKYFSVGGSVATAAFNVARTVESRVIVLVGQDLAFDGDATHAGGEREEHFTNKNIRYVDGVDGKKVKTREDWLRFLGWYESTISELDEDIEIIDATEGGAKIEGTKIMKLSKVIDQYCKESFDFQEVLKKLRPTFDGDKYLEIRQDLLHLEQEILTVKECAEKGKMCTEDWSRLFDNDVYDLNTDIQYSETIKKMNEIIEEQLVYTIIDEFIKPEVDHIMMDINCLSDDERKNIKGTCQMSKIMYEKILDAVSVIEPILEEALKRV